MTKIYIIESPSFMDIFENRSEISALSDMLNLANIENQVYKVSDRETLELAFKSIADDFNSLSKKIVVNIHFSLHGSEDGIALSDNTIIEWEEFSKIIKELNEAIGYIRLGDKRISFLALNFSVCNGFSARKIEEYSSDQLFYSLIGPTQTVSWADSLIGFAVYYHNLLKKNVIVKKAIENVNLILNENDLFKVIAGKEMGIREE